MTHHNESIPDFVEGGEGSFAFTTFFLHLWPCINSGNSNNFHSLRRIPQMSTSSCNPSSIQFNSYGMRSSSFEIKYGLKKAPFAILCNVFSIFFCNDFTENLRPCRRFPIYIKPLIKIIEIDTKLCNLFCVAQSTWKCGKSSKETLYLWYVVEKQPKGGGFGS